MKTIKQTLTALLVAASTIAMPISAIAADDDIAFAKFLGNYGVETLPEAWMSDSAKRTAEPHEERVARIHMIAELTVEEAPKAVKEHGWFWSESDLATAAYTMMWYESGRFNVKVHNGTIRGDHGKSVCLGQVMYGGNALVGTDRESTRRCIAAVMKHLVTHQKRCLNSRTPPSSWAMAKVLSGYGTGYSCSVHVWFPVKDELGNDKFGNDGKQIRDFWALKRSYTWWQMRKATETK